MTLPKRPDRTFSKRILIANMVGVWIVLLYAIYSEQADVLASAAFNFLVMMFGLYIGVGHMDLRTLLQTPMNPPYQPPAEPPYEGEPRGHHRPRRRDDYVTNGEEG